MLPVSLFSISLSSQHPCLSSTIPTQGVLRMIFAFYAGIDLADAPHQELNLNHVTAMHPHAYGCEIEVINLLQENAGDDGQKNH